MGFNATGRQLNRRWEPSKRGEVMKKAMRRVKCFFGRHGSFEAMAGENAPQPNKYCGRCGKQIK